MTNEKEEHKPCPGCGDPPHFRLGDIMSVNSYRCLNIDCPINFMSSAVWNDLYCWRALAKRDEMLKVAEKALGDVISTLPNPLAWTNEDMDKIRGAKEVLEKLKMREK